MSTAATSEDILAAAGRVAEPPRPLPFAFAKRSGVLVRGLTDTNADVVVRNDASPLAVAEVGLVLSNEKEILPLDLPEIQSISVEEVVREKVQEAYRRLGRPSRLSRPCRAPCRGGPAASGCRRTGRTRTTSRSTPCTSRTTASTRS